MRMIVPLAPVAGLNRGTPRRDIGELGPDLGPTNYVSQDPIVNVNPHDMRNRVDATRPRWPARPGEDLSKNRALCYYNDGGIFSVRLNFLMVTIKSVVPP